MKNKSMIFVVIATALCANILFAANLVNNGDFELPVIPVGANNGGPVDSWYVQATGGGLLNGTAPSPMSGQVLWYNSAALYMYQTFEGVKLLPNRIYIVKCDIASVINAGTINVKLQYGTGSGTNSRQLASLDAADITDVVVSNGTWLAGWRGAQFASPLDPADNDASIYHEFSFTTPAVLTGSTTDDLSITIGGPSAVQVKVDNVSVEVVPEPAAICLLAILGFAFLRRK